MKKLKKVLLIDDDKVNNHLNEMLLEEVALAEEIVVLTNGQQGLEYLQEHCERNQACPALVILDHFMPVMDGLEMMQHLNQSGFINQHEVVFILLGIHSSKADIEAFLKLGVQEFTSKPLSKEVLLDAYYKYWEGDTAKFHS